jgi:transcriptional regulator with PAS, ATPase and Fis domain
LGIFIESLCEKNYSLKSHQKIIVISSSVWVFYFFYIAIVKFNISDLCNREFELLMMQIGTLVQQLFLFMHLIITIKKLRNIPFPKILKKQLTTLIKYLLTPYIITQLFESIFTFQNFLISVTPLFIYVITAISTTLLMFALGHSIKKIMRLRFLNFAEHIQAPFRFTFANNLRKLLPSLSKATTLNEVSTLGQLFFENTFNLNSNRFAFYFRNIARTLPFEEPQKPRTLLHEETVVERLINNPLKNGPLLEHLSKQHILMYDEVEFSEFYLQDSLNREILSFLSELHAEVFLPVYDQETMVAYIIISYDARNSNRDFFSNVEHDEMVAVAGYLGNTIMAVHNKNIKELFAHYKEATNDVYAKCQKNNQYRETVLSFVNNNKQHQTGILFYKNYQFTFVNQDAKELIPLNINILDGHPITKILKTLVKHVEDYKASQSTTIDFQDKQLMITAFQHLEKNTIIIIVRYLEISDIVKIRIDQLRDPSEIDYALYLETNDSGKIINRLIPSSARNLYNFKINLLKAALSKKATLLIMEEDDLQPTADVLHYISLRTNIYTLNLKNYEKNHSIASKLFGMNPVFGTFEQALLEHLNNVGTLFIQNIHLLELSTQEMLAQFIKYGYYSAVKSSKQIFADVRVLCSSSVNLQQLVTEGKFSKILFDELQETTLIFPSLFELPPEEFDDLIKGLSLQSINSNTDLSKKFLEFTARDKEKLITTRSTSLAGLRKKVTQILVEKSRKHEVYHSITFDPASQIADPELAEAARLGKNALRDRKKLVMLMERFDGNQNKVAAFLGVNRSSVNRRLKAYKIEVYDSAEQKTDTYLLQGLQTI